MAYGNRISLELALMEARRKAGRYDAMMGDYRDMRAVLVDNLRRLRVTMVGVG